MKCVLEASVIVKLPLRDAESESDRTAARSLIDTVAGGEAANAYRKVDWKFLHARSDRP